MKSLLNIVVLLCGLAGSALSLRAQLAVPPPMPVYQPLAQQELDQLLGPIALYPDPLIAQILPASTFPAQIVLADRYVSGGGDPGRIDDQPWDPSVQALARYPEVLKWMDDNLNWTTDLGQAFLNQPQDVMDSIQRLRRSAYNLGNLQSTPQEQVIDDGSYLEIVPVDPQVIYVPVYQPDQVYYQTAYGSPFISFGVAWPIGVWLNCDFDWGNHVIIVWGHDHPRPHNWWHEPRRQRDMSHTRVWHPDHRPGPGWEQHRGDRGWGDTRNPPVTPPVVATVSRSVSDSAAPRRTPAPTARPAAPAPGVHPEPVGRPAANGAFIGIQSSHDARTYSDRGQQSLRTVTHSEPPSRPAPVSHPAPSGGGGGGGHNSDHQRGH